MKNVETKISSLTADRKPLPEKILAQTGTLGNRIFRTTLLIMASIILLIVAAMIGKMVRNSLPTIQEYGISFLTGRE